MQMMWCQFCDSAFESVLSYCQHMKMHSHVPNANFKCGIPDCPRRFKKFAAFKAHIFRDHKNRDTKMSAEQLGNAYTLICDIGVCQERCSDLRNFILHLKSHIKEGTRVPCPFKCNKSFSFASTLTSHISRNHRNSSSDRFRHNILHLNFSVQRPHGEEYNVAEDSNALSDSFMDCGDGEEQVDIALLPDNANESLFLKNMALFYLKLQAKHILPSSVIQSVIEGLQDIHDISQSHLLHRVSEKLTTLGISENDVKNVVDIMKTDDLFRMCNTHALHTDKRRKSFYKANFKYVEPVPICLGKNESGKESFAQYIPIKQSLEALFCCKSVIEQHKNSQSTIKANYVLSDVWDGSNVDDNVLLKDDTDSLALILYQDAFEVANPLGSGKKKHKILAVYMTLGNLFPYYRSRIDHMQLVLLCKEQDFKFFGQDSVFATLVKDLKDLEENGVLLADGKVHKGTLCAIAGDNLGSHCIGGFVENFSRSNHFCRFCEIDRQTFLSAPLTKALPRTVMSYEQNLRDLDSGAAEIAVGVKCNSPFNDLKYFHVCQPGLPPCLGHDLFEGVVSFDLALYVDHLVNQEKQFTYAELNRRISQFKYLGNDARDKPANVTHGTGKLSGHAVQNWCLLRLLPLLVGEKIANPTENEVWQLILQLRQIAELICAPVITVGQIAYLAVLIEEYIEARKMSFPSHPLKPKHHYMSHYPELIERFGPLIRLWTMRFESKHSYFKQCARKLHNFKNLSATLAERHQLLQAYLNSGSIFPENVVAEKGTEFHASDYNDDIQGSVACFHFEPGNTLASNEVTVKGTLYKKNLHVILQNNDEGIVFGRIQLILVHNNSSVYFVTLKCQSFCLVDQGVHCLTSQDKGYLCINQDSLLDYYPLPKYSLCGLSVIVLHHSFPILE